MGFKNYAGDAWNWVWRNKGGIAGGIGGTLYGIGATTNMPYSPVLKVAGEGLVGVGQAIKFMEEGEAKKAMEKKYKEELDAEKLRMFGSKSVAVSDIPRISYSRMPPPPPVHNILAIKYDKMPSVKKDKILAIKHEKKKIINYPRFPALKYQKQK